MNRIAARIPMDGSWADSILAYDPAVVGTLVQMAAITVQRHAARIQEAASQPRRKRIQEINAILMDELATAALTGIQFGIELAAEGYKFQGKTITHDKGEDAR